MLFPQPRTLTKVNREEQSFLSISDNNKTSDINSHSVPSLLCPAAWHQHPGAAVEGGRGEKGESTKRKEGSEESLKGEREKGKTGGKESD